MRLITSSRTMTRCQSAPGEMQREQHEEDRPDHQMVQPGELRQPEIGDEADQRRADEIEVEPDMHGARQPLQRPESALAAGGAPTVWRSCSRHSIAARIARPTAI